MRVTTEVISGKPLKVGDRDLIPVVRRTVGVWRQATIGTRHNSAQGMAFVRLQPLGMLERRGEEERFIPIPDRTRQMLGGLLAAAVVIPLLLTLAVRLARK